MSEELYAQLENEIKRAVSQETDPFRVLSAVLKAFRETMQKLREYVAANPFRDQNEEIRFFKQVKPRFMGRRIFYLEWYGLKSDLPVGDTHAQRRFYRKELKNVRRFFRRIAFHYRYYRSGATELDSLYFVRGMEVPSIPIPEMPEPEPGFSTAGDYLFAKIRAYELLQEFILEEIRKLDNPGKPGDPMPDLPKLKWTGEQVNLVELAYGIYYTGQLNHGKVEVKDIIALFEAVFQVKIKAAYHVFGNIRRRKSISTTAYIDRMREAIQQRVDEDLAHHPNRDMLRNRR